MGLLLNNSLAITKQFYDDTTFPQLRSDITNCCVTYRGFASHVSRANSHIGYSEKPMI